MTNILGMNSDEEEEKTEKKKKGLFLLTVFHFVVELLVKH